MWLLAVLLLADSSRAMRIVVAPGESLQVTVAGAGRPVVFVPGLFGAAFGYRKVIPPLMAAGYRTIVVEPLAVGNSGRPERADYSLTAQANRVAAVLDTLDLRDAIVVAHSLGCAIGLRLAYRHPERVGSLILVDGAAAGTATSPGFRRAVRYIPWVKWLGGARVVREMIRRTLIAASGDPSWVSDEVVSDYTAGAAADLDGTLKAFLRMADARDRDRLESHLAEIQVPVTLIVGGAPHPEAIGNEEVEQLRRDIAAFRADTVTGAGHFIQEEQPEAIVRAVRELPPSATLTTRGAAGGAR